jgi:hypothetical protein
MEPDEGIPAMPPIHFHHIIIIICLSNLLQRCVPRSVAKESSISHGEVRQGPKYGAIRAPTLLS